MDIRCTVSNIALAISTTLLLTACSETSSGGGGEVDVGGNLGVFCEVATIGASDPSYNGSVDDPYDGKYPMQLKAGVNGDTLAGGTIEWTAATGAFTYTPPTAIAGARGFKDSFEYVFMDGDEEFATATHTIIYGAKRIMPLGDSITYGVTNYDSTTGTDFPTDSSDMAVGYRKPLFDSLISAGYAVDFVGTISDGTAANLADPDHQSIPGIRADRDDGSTYNLNDLATGWLNSAPADIVLLHAGTNDLAHTTPEEAASAVHNIVKTLHDWHLTKNQTPLLVMPAKIIPSLRTDAQQSSTQIEAMNTALDSQLDSNITDFASTFSVNVVDQYSNFNADQHISDNDDVKLHPNTSGYAVMASVWHEELMSIGQLNKCD